MNYFMYNGKSSLDMGLRIESKDIFSAPAYDVNFQSIPGRNGDLIISNGKYPNVQVTYSVFVVAKTVSELSQKLTAIKAWLYSDQNTYNTLTDSYDTKYIRQAVFCGKLDISDRLNKIGCFTVTFSCKPFRYLKTGLSSVTLNTNSITLFNPEVFESRPYMKILGNGDLTLTIQSTSNNRTWIFRGVTEFIEIDSEQMNVYKGTVLKNDTVTGDGFPVLYPNGNSFTWNSNVTSIKLTPRWVTL